MRIDNGVMFKSESHGVVKMTIKDTRYPREVMGKMHSFASDYGKTAEEEIEEVDPEEDLEEEEEDEAWDDDEDGWEEEDGDEEEASDASE